ncbi:MAG TPA: hypothetical protein VNM87_07030, partial [Candidatus Udaeobacter sp.]|nr:hypothetical protein [Candidatus Udaeobacter sp.]
MTSAHLPTDSSSPALASLRERLAQAARRGEPDPAAALALAHLDPEAARAWLAGEERATLAWPDGALAGLLALLVERAIAADDRRVLRELGALLWRFAAAAEPGTVHCLLSQLTPAELESAPFPELLARSRERAPGHAGLLRVASEAALRTGGEAAHALLTQLGRADSSPATIQHVFRSRQALPAPAGPG